MWLTDPDFLWSARRLTQRDLYYCMVSAANAYRSLRQARPGVSHYVSTATWEGYESALLAYLVALHNESLDRLAAKVADVKLVPHPVLVEVSELAGGDVLPGKKPRAAYGVAPTNYLFPWWFGCPEVHKSHRSHLYHRSPKDYPDFAADYDRSLLTVISSGLSIPIFPGRESLEAIKYRCPWVWVDGACAVPETPLPPNYRVAEDT